MFSKFTRSSSPFSVGLLTFSMFFFSSHALANEAETTPTASEESQTVSQNSYPSINMDNAKFSKGFEDMKGFLNAANFDPSKPKAYGSPDAPLTLYNFSSYSCSHCKKFHDESLGKIHQKYVAGGKLRIVFTNIAFDQLGLFLTNGSFATQDLKQYMSYSSAIYENQNKVFSKDAEAEVKKILAAESITFEDFYNTATNPELSANMMKFLEYTSKILNVEGTPTFILAKTGESPEQALGRVSGNDEKAVIDMIEKALKGL